VGLLKKAHTSILNNVIIYLTMPALIFRAVFESDISLSLLIIPVLAIAIVSLSMGLAYLAGRFLRLEAATFGALILAAAIGNTGYLGYPLVLQLFGIENLVRAVFYDLAGTVVFTFTIGLLVAQKYGQNEGKVNIVKEIFTFPPLIALFAALVFKSAALPEFLTDTIDFMAGATVPLIMLTIGLSLELTGVGKYKTAIATVVIVKLILSPLIALVGAGLIGVSDVDLGVIVLEASMPTFLLSLVIGLKYGLDVDFLPPAIVTTTMLSMVTIPLWQYVARL